MKDLIKSIIIDFQNNFAIDLIEREVSIPLDIGINKVITIYGPRRTGKTYLLFQIIKNLIKNKKNINIQNIIYINFEDNRLIDIHAKDLDLIYISFKELYPDKEPYFFLDEIQNISNWSKWVRKLVDKGFKVFITGSNSRYLSKEIATELRGRTISFLLLPFSFNEYLKFKKIKIDKNILFNTNKYANLKFHLNEYLLSGGFPEILKLKNLKKEIILKDYINLIIYQDVVDRYKIKNIYILKYLINFFLQNYGNILSVNKIFNSFISQNIKISKNTIYEYIEYLSDALFIFKVNKYDISLKKQMMGMKKIYIIDTGYSNLYKYKLDKGRLFENLFFLELKRKYETIFYYKNNYECDFIIKDERNDLFFQITYNIENIYTFKREVNSLISVLNKFNKKEGFIITFDKKDNIFINGKTIRIIPFIEWYLEFFK